MSFRKTENKNDVWNQYCEKKSDLINELKLNDWIFNSELNFRAFATYGQIEENGEDKFSFKELNNQL